MPAIPKHTISVSIEGQRLDGWSSYEISSSILDAVDHFTMTRPFESDAYRLCELDSRIKVKIDDVVILDGFIGRRQKKTTSKTNTMTIIGTDKVGRLVKESAENVNYAGELTDVAKRLVAPWFSEVVLSDARNRTVRLGKRQAQAAPGEALVKAVKIKKSWLGERWRIEPGQPKWKVLTDIASEAGLMVWSSADGTEIVIGQPDYNQPVQFLIAAPESGSPVEATALAIDFDESIEDRYSLIRTVGAGAGDGQNYGDDVSSITAIAKNGPGIDGTGVDFKYPKRLVLAERSLKNHEEAVAYVAREMSRRDFSAQAVTATMPAHGQITRGTSVALFAPNTISRVIDGEQDLPIDGAYAIHTCRYRGTRDEQTTELQLVPRGTVFAQ